MAKGGAGNVVAPPLRSKWDSSQEARGARGFAKNDYSAPGEQKASNKAYRGGQSAGVKGFAQDPNARKY